MITLILELKKKIKKYFRNISTHLSVISDRLELLTLASNEIKEKLDIIIGKEENQMTQIAQEFEALRVALDEASNAVAARIDVLAGKVKNSMTDEEVASLKAGLQTEIDQLKGLAADPTDPVPEPTPPVDQPI